MVGKIIPAELSVRINNGAKHAKTQNVVLDISATNARECRYRNEEFDWGAWEPYRLQKIWVLSEGDGQKTVSFQCKNTGESGVAQASIVMDTKTPIIAYAASVVEGEAFVNIIAKDAISPSVKCTVTKDGTSEEISIQLYSAVGSYLYKTPLTEGQHVFGLKCSDEAGNEREMPQQTITK